MNKYELYYEIDCAIIHLINLQKENNITKYDEPINDLINYKTYIRKELTETLIDEPCIRCALKHLLKILNSQETSEIVKTITQKILDQTRSGGST